MDDTIFDKTNAFDLIICMEEVNNRSARARVPNTYLALLAYIAGKKIDIPPGELKEGFSSLHKFPEYQDLFSEARRNLKEGRVPGNWYEQASNVINKIIGEG